MLFSATFSAIVSSEEIVGSCSLTSTDNVTVIVQTCPPAATTDLKIQDIQLDSIPTEIFDQYTLLQSLDMKSNQLPTIANATFSKLKKLKTLYVVNNSLTSFPARAFVNCASLMTIDFSQNNISGLQNDNFFGLTSLTNLDLSQNQISTIDDDAFSSLVQLKELRLTQNRIQIIDKTLFARNHKLEMLYLDENEIAIIQPEAFWNLNNLRTLELNNNSRLTNVDLTHMNKLQDVFVNGAALVKLNVPATISKIYASNNVILNIQVEPNSTLKELDLEKNLCRDICQFGSLARLEELKLDFNNISTVDFGCLQNMTALRFLKLKNNPIRDLNATALLTYLPGLKSIQISAKNFDKPNLDKFIDTIKINGSNKIKIKDENDRPLNDVTTTTTTTTPMPVSDATPSPTDSANVSNEINLLLARIDKLETYITAKEQEGKANDSIVQSEMEQSVANLRLMIVWTILAFSAFVSFQIIVFVRQNYKRFRLPVNSTPRNVIQNGRNRSRSHESVSPILEEVL